MASWRWAIAYLVAGDKGSTAQSRFLFFPTRPHLTLPILMGLTEGLLLPKPGVTIDSPFGFLIFSS